MVHHIILTSTASNLLEWLIEVGDSEGDISALAIDPAPQHIPRDDPRAWLGDRDMSITELHLPPIPLQRHLQECLNKGRLGSLLDHSISGCIFHVTRMHEVASWATTVRLEPEQPMRLGVRFSQATGNCVGFGWHGRLERHSLTPSHRESESLAQKSAAFMSVFYIFARGDGDQEPHSPQPIATEAPTRSVPSTHFSTTSGAQAASAGGDVPEGHSSTSHTVSTLSTACIVIDPTFRTTFFFRATVPHLSLLSTFLLYAPGYVARK
jgi:hypothetical protein